MKLQGKILDYGGSEADHEKWKLFGGIGTVVVCKPAWDGRADSEKCASIVCSAKRAIVISCCGCLLVR